MATADSKLPSHMYTTPTCVCAVVVTVHVGCRLNAPGPLNFIREGSSGSRKF